jgi:hypothetical protein
MADSLFEKLKKEKEKQGDLVHEVVIKIGENELEIVQKKAQVLGMQVGQLLREYVCQTGVFDNSPFMEKKSKKIMKKEKITDEKL